MIQGALKNEKYVSDFSWKSEGTGWKNLGVYGCDIKMDLENRFMRDLEWTQLAQNIVCLLNNLKSVNFVDVFNSKISV
jgi:hypothetical protein